MSKTVSLFTKLMLLALTTITIVACNTIQEVVEEPVAQPQGGDLLAELYAEDEEREPDNATSGNVANGKEKQNPVGMSQNQLSNAAFASSDENQAGSGDATGDRRLRPSDNRISNESRSM